MTAAEASELVGTSSQWQWLSWSKRFAVWLAKVLAREMSGAYVNIHKLDLWLHHRGALATGVEPGRSMLGCPGLIAALRCTPGAKAWLIYVFTQ